MNAAEKLKLQRWQVLGYLEGLGVGAFGLTVDEMHRDSLKAREPLSRPAIARILRDALERDTPLVSRQKGNTVGRPWKYTITFAGLAELDDMRAGITRSEAP